MDKGQRAVVGFFITAACFLVGRMAKAETVILDKTPSSVITPSEAGKSKTPVFECQKVHQGPNVNPVKVPGSKSIWTKGPLKGIDNGGDLLSDGKTVFRCKTKQRDNETGRMKAA